GRRTNGIAQGNGGILGPAPPGRCARCRTKQRRGGRTLRFASDQPGGSRVCPWRPPCRKRVTCWYSLVYNWSTGIFAARRQRSGRLLRLITSVARANGGLYSMYTTAEGLTGVFRDKSGQREDCHDNCR